MDAGSGKFSWYRGYCRVFSKVVALILSLSLIVPVGSAVEKANSAQLGTTAREAPVNSTPGETARQTPEPITEDEQVSLSARAEEPEADVKGGALSNLHLTYAVIALAAIVLVLILK